LRGVGTESKEEGSFVLHFVESPDAVDLEFIAVALTIAVALAAEDGVLVICGVEPRVLDQGISPKEERRLG